MKTVIFFAFVYLAVVSTPYAKNHPMTTNHWEGAWWRQNVSQGSWFPSFDTLADFSIDDYSWGQVRTLDTVSFGDSIQVSAQFLLNSGGVNTDEAYFCVGNQWVLYGGGNYFGIAFYNGKVTFWENGTYKDSIGTYTVGELINFTLILNSNGTLSTHSTKFSGTYTPDSTLQTRKWILASKGSQSHQGFLVTSVNPHPPGPLGVFDSKGSVPNRLYLSQNYPNPFNPTTTVSYAIPGRSQVKLEVYNTLGQMIASLVNSIQEAGYYDVPWQVPQHGISSGLYFYRLAAVDVSNPAKSFVQVRKMVLLK